MARKPRIIFAGLFLFLGLLPAHSFAQDSRLQVTRLGAITSYDPITVALTSGDEMWAAAILTNVSVSPMSISWTMTLDGRQISYGAWTVPPGRSVLLTSIDSETAAAGTHTLELKVVEGAAVVARASAELVASGATAAKQSTWGHLKARYRTPSTSSPGTQDR